MTPEMPPFHVGCLHLSGEACHRRRGTWQWTLILGVWREYWLWGRDDWGCFGGDAKALGCGPLFLLYWSRL